MGMEPSIVARLTLATGATLLPPIMVLIYVCQIASHTGGVRDYWVIGVPTAVGAIFAISSLRHWIAKVCVLGLYVILMPTVLWFLMFWSAGACQGRWL